MVLPDREHLFIEYISGGRIMKKGTSTALWVVGGAAVLWYLMRQNQAAQPAQVVNNAGQTAAAPCPLTSNIQTAICDLTNVFNA